MYICLQYLNKLIFEMANFKRELNLYDAVMLVSGTMIGSGIFLVSADVARQTGDAGWLLLSWIIAGGLTMMAALSYGELASMFPQAGGQYVFLQKAYNRLVGFLYGWSFFTVIQTGTIAAVAVAFAKYTGVLAPDVINDNPIVSFGGSFQITSQRLLAILSIVLLTYTNTKGVKLGKIIQNVFSSTKLIALAFLIVIGFIFANSEVIAANFSVVFSSGPTAMMSNVSGEWMGTTIAGMGIILALGATQVGTLFSSDAWHGLATAGDEVINPERNIPRGLAIGTLLVTVLYLLTNLVYLFILPLQGSPEAADVMGRGIQFASQDRVAAATAEAIGGPSMAIFMAVLIMISTFGCNNGLILTGARMTYTMAKDNLFFKNFGKLNSAGVPSSALWWQCVWAGVLCLSGKYGDLLDYLMTVVILFYVLTIIGIFILRKKMPNHPRPIKAPLYPVLPILYVIIATAIIVILMVVKPQFTIPGLIIVAIGVPVYYWFRRSSKE
jgi:APA family basic amino acid/polyamine antiporter